MTSKRVTLGDLKSVTLGDLKSVTLGDLKSVTLGDLKSVTLGDLKSVTLGYACINTKLPSPNRTCRQATFEKKGKQYAIELARINLERVIHIIEWNQKNNIKLYRLSSDMFPHITNPKFCNSDQFTYSLDIFSSELQRISELRGLYGHRLTFHPGQYNQIGAKNPLIFEKTKKDLQYQADILDWFQNNDGVMVVHGGGTYGDKEGTKKRWVSQFSNLSSNIKNKIVIENCERQYGIEDVLELSQKVKRPVIFDTHHHDCYDKLVEDQLPAEFYIDEILDSWKMVGQKPKFHVSNQHPLKRIGAHSDFVKEIPNYLLNIDMDIDVMIEAKMKEQSVLKVMG